MSPKLAIAIETSTRRGSLAIRHRGETREAYLDSGSIHARSLLPTLENLLQSVGAEREAIDFLAVGLGPGSYTGLRVGIATALTLAGATRAPLVGVCSFAAMAWEVPGEGSIAAIGNAYGGELYFALFEKRGGSLRETGALNCLPPEEIAGKLPPDAQLLGDGVPLLPPEARSSLRILAPESLWTPRPRAVLELGLRRFQEKGPDDPRSVRPLYLRASRAEIVRDQKKSSPSAP